MLKQVKTIQNVEIDKIVSGYVNFAINKLPTLKSQQTQQTCIKLVEECVRVCDWEENDVKLLKFMDNVFEGNMDRSFEGFY